MNLISGALVSIVYLVYCFTLGRENLLLGLIWGLWVVGSAIDVTWLLNGCQEFKIPMVRNFCTRLGGMAFIFLFVHTEADTWAYVFAISAPFFINAVLVWPFVRRYVDHVKPTWNKMVGHLKPNLLLFIPVIATSLYTLLDKVMLGLMAGYSETGMYDYAEKISKMPMAIITALGAVVLPKMTEVIAAGKMDEARGLIRTTMWFMEACASALCCGIIAVAPEFVPVFFGPGYEPCIQLMSLLSLIIPLICATNVMGIQYLVPSHRDKGFTASVLVGAMADLIINAILIPAFGAMGAAIATVISELAVLCVQAWLIRRELELAAYLRGTIPFVIIGIIMIAAIRAVSTTLIALSARTTLILLVEIIFGGTLYLALSFVWCRQTHNSDFERLFPRFAK